MLCWHSCKTIVLYGGNEGFLRISASYTNIANFYVYSNDTDVGPGMNSSVDSAQDRDYWKTLVNAALNLRVQ